MVIGDPCWTADLALSLHSAHSTRQWAAYIAGCMLTFWYTAHMWYSANVPDVASTSSDWTCQDLAVYGTYKDLAASMLAIGVDTMSTADVLAELAYLNPRNKRKGKGGRQPAMDPRLDPNVDPKKAKRILANRLSAARSKMKQKSHVEVILPGQV